MWKRDEMQGRRGGGGGGERKGMAVSRFRFSQFVFCVFVFVSGGTSRVSFVLKRGSFTISYPHSTIPARVAPADSAGHPPLPAGVDRSFVNPPRISLFSLSSLSHPQRRLPIPSHPIHPARSLISYSPRTEASPSTPEPWEGLFRVRIAFVVGWKVEGEGGKCSVRGTFPARSVLVGKGDFEGEDEGGG